MIACAELPIPATETIYSTVVEETIKNDLPFFFHRHTWRNDNLQETMRATRKVVYGENGLEAIVKWDSPPNSAHGALTRERGNTTANDLHVLLQREHPERYYLSRLLHANKVTIDGQDIVYIVEPVYPGKDMYAARREGRFSPKQTVSIFEKVIIGVRRYVEHERRFHRDLTLHNIILDGNDPIITDWGLAARTDKRSSPDRATAGKRSFTDPNLAVGAPYTIQSEMWSLGVCMLSAELGRDLYRLDDSGFWINDDTNLLSEGKIDILKWNAYLHSRIDEMRPTVRRKLGPIVERLLSIDNRYDNLNELQQAYAKSTRNIFHPKSSMMKALMTMSAIGMLSSAGFALQSHEQNETLRTELAQEQVVFDVSRDYGSGLNIRSNVAIIQPVIDNSRTATAHPQILATAVRGLSVDPGQEFSVYLNGWTSPPGDRNEHNTIPPLPGEIRIEGYTAKKQPFTPGSGGSVRYDLADVEMSGALPFPTEFHAPTTPGVYRLLSDVYARTDAPGYDNNVILRITEQDRPVLRQVTPLVVGDVPEGHRVILDGAGFNGLGFVLDFRPVSEQPHAQIAPGMTYEVHVPKQGFSYRTNTLGPGSKHVVPVDIPARSFGEESTLFVTALANGSPVHFACVPIKQMEGVLKKGVWDVTLPSRAHEETCAAYRSFFLKDSR